MKDSNKANIGEDIKNIVQNALQNSDFKSLSKDLESLVKDLLKEFNINSEDNKTKASVRVNINRSKTEELKEKLLEEKKLRESQNQQRALMIKKPSHAVPVGKTSAIVSTVFGSIGLGLFGIPYIILLAIGLMGGLDRIINIINFGLFLPLTLLSGGLLINGKETNKRLTRFKRYLTYMDQRDYYLVSELATAIGKSEKATLKDLKKMISLRMFPEGRIVDNDRYFVLTNKSYGEYMKLKEGDKLKELENQSSISLPQGQVLSLDSETEKIINEGKAFVKEIKSANVAIPGEEISKKLDSLEEVTDKIFDYVILHPEKLPEIKKFMEYFLPTTLKLLDAYQKLDNQPVQGRNIASSKKEIEDTIDTINHAFENLLDDLFEDMAMDVSTDISVLKTIFAQEGLIDDKIRNKNIKGDE